jgi:thioredoxin reductase
MLEVGPNLLIVLLAIIAGVPGLAAAYYAYRANQRAVKVEDKTTEIGHAIDGRMDTILKLSKAASRVEGVAAGANGEQPGTRPLEEADR